MIASPVCAQGDDPDGEIDPILVTGTLQKGAAHTTISPEIQVDRTTLRTLGANSLGEIAEIYTPQSGSSRGTSEAVFLLNGRRIGDRSEIDQLPPEAILRVEVLSEEVARQYGYPPDRRIINVILRPRYRAIELQANGDLPFGEGRSTYRGKADLLRLDADGRLHLDLRGRFRTELDDEAARSTIGERWIYLRSERLSANASLARIVDGNDLTLSADFHDETNRLRLGDGLGAESLESRQKERRGRLGLTIGSPARDWRWTASAAVELGHDSLATGDGRGIPVGAPGLQVRSSRQHAEATFFASDELGSLVAGPVSVNLGGGFGLNRAQAVDSGAVLNTRDIRQDSAYLSAGFDMPLADREALVLFGSGKVTTTNGGAALGEFGAGMRSSPLSGISLTVSYDRARRLPDFDDLADLQTLIPNYLTYDFALDRTVYALRHAGGNPFLSPARTEIFAARFNWQALEEPKIAFALDYTEVASRTPVSGTLGPTPQVELAFPERFERDQTGMLVAFDERPTNFEREWRRQLRSSLSVSTSGSNQWQIALFHTLVLQHEAILAAGSPQIDLMEGAAFGPEGGTPRHRIEAQLGYAARHFGVRLSGEWESERRVRDIAQPGTLRFTEGFDVDLRVFIDFNHLGERIGQGWLGGRLYLALDNIFDSRSRVRNGVGQSVGFYRQNEPQGRSISMTFRKMFYGI